eukprot:3017490-Pyramimonas_sp.AAC.1
MIYIQPKKPRQMDNTCVQRIPVCAGCGGRGPSGRLGQRRRGRPCDGPLRRLRRRPRYWCVGGHAAKGLVDLCLRKAFPSQEVLL